MAFNIKSLSRYATSQRGTGIADKTDFYVYSTADSLATVQTAGYFNSAREALKPGDLITASVGIGGTAATAIVRVVTSPASGNVTVATALTTA